MQNFNYGDYFRRVQDMKKLQVDAADIKWLERYEKPAERHSNVLYLGCNIFRTPHIAKQVIQVFEHLDVDFVAVGGIQYCCGVIWDDSNDIAQGQGVSRRTIERLESHGPQRVIMWCPSCNVHFADKVMGRDRKEPDFEITHATQFLADIAKQPKGLPWRQEVKKRVVLHAHSGREGHEEGQRRALDDREAALTLLGQVPGLEIIETIVSEPEMDYDCGPAARKLDRSTFRDHQRETIRKALDRDAEQIVTISHACQREWCGENTGQLGFRNYISVVAEGLGLPVQIDYLSMLKADRSVDEIIETSRVAWASHGMTAEQAREIVERYVKSGDLRGYDAVSPH